MILSNNSYSDCQQCLASTTQSQLQLVSMATSFSLVAIGMFVLDKLGLTAAILFQQICCVIVSRNLVAIWTAGFP